jgi:hypothetical protein
MYAFNPKSDGYTKMRSRAFSEDAFDILVTHRQQRRFFSCWCLRGIGGFDPPPLPITGGGGSQAGGGGGGARQEVGVGGALWDILT